MFESVISLSVTTALTCLFFTSLALAPLTYAFANEKSRFERPFNGRSRAHLDSLANAASHHNKETAEFVLSSLSQAYSKMIKPLEDAYKFSSLRTNSLSEGEIFSLPQIAFFGSWSAGKTSVINYILGIENTTYRLETGAEPTTTDFTVISYGKDKSVDGLVLVMDSTYASLKKYGQPFLERFRGKQLPCSLLNKVTFLDTPGIIENRKQQERGYPFNEVSQWFIDHADLIVVVFDHTKLDVGAELEKLFRLLKGHEAKVRIVLNKADTVTPNELMRVYGALFWSLSPLIKVTEPPRVYVTSLWSKEFNPTVGRNRELLLEEESALLKDMETVIKNAVEKKVAFVRQYAVHVRNHALLVSQYYKTLKNQRSIFGSSDAIAASIVETPEKHGIYENTAANENVSIYDLQPPETYKKFFSLHRMDSFRDVSYHCSVFGSCLMDRLDRALHEVLPKLIESLQQSECIGGKCDSGFKKPKIEL